MLAQDTESNSIKTMQERPTSTVSGQGLARNSSFRSRPVRKTPLRSSFSDEASSVENDSVAMNAHVISDLKIQVERAEQASELYRRQLEGIQKHLEESSDRAMAAEEREFQFRTQIDHLQAQLKDTLRQCRDLELSQESERKLMLQERERQSSREADLHSIVNRLTENLRYKTQELANANKSDIPPEANRPEDDLFLILQAKDNTIESLRLEVADIQLKIAEQEHTREGKWQILEKELVDFKMKNARLQEENESFQMLLSERTIKGDFLHDQTERSKSVHSLADELESAQHTEISMEKYHAIESENRGLRDSNKALTLYIDKIIGRLLQHEGFEHIIKDEPIDSTANLNKALPEPPSVLPRTEPPAGMGASLLQRARSVVVRPAGTPKPRPLSLMPTANENPATAPSIPINKTHRRARSDQASDLAAANVIQQMNRGSQLRTTSNGPLSPGLKSVSPISTQRQSYFGGSNRPTPTPGSRPDSSSNSVVSERSFEAADLTDASSMRTGGVPNSSAIPGAVMKQNQLRPLRLVQNKALEEEEQKKANRGSWMGWFNKGVPNSQE